MNPSPLKYLLVTAVAVASLHCTPLVAAPQRADHDGDLISDLQDACPEAPGLLTDDPKTNGCPPPPDKDRDTILDFADACPTSPGRLPTTPA
jgi:hypothetical protein